MANGKVVGIYVSPIAGGPMQEVAAAQAIAGAGLRGDRYCTGEGSFSKGEVGRRQVTLINARFFANSGFQYIESRRNIITSRVELMWLIGREFQVGRSLMRGVKYCDPCKRPSVLSRNVHSFEAAFFDCGGIVAEIIDGDIITLTDPVIPPPKEY